MAMGGASVPDASAHPFRFQMGGERVSVQLSSYSVPDGDDELRTNIFVTDSKKEAEELNNKITKAGQGDQAEGQGDQVEG
jgi:hypothetical protein